MALAIPRSREFDIRCLNFSANKMCPNDFYGKIREGMAVIGGKKIERLFCLMTALKFTKVKVTNYELKLDN